MAKKWIQKAHLKKGTFTAWCKQQGFGGVTEACIQAGLKSSDDTIRRRAQLAKTFRKMKK
jgi:hypothetical protein